MRRTSRRRCSMRSTASNAGTHRSTSRPPRPEAPRSGPPPSRRPTRSWSPSSRRKLTSSAPNGRRRWRPSAMGENRCGVAWGQFVANAILDWRSTDGFTPAPPPYLGSNAPGQWRPTPPALAPGAVPQFATMTPWGILSPDQFRPPGPPALGSDQYLRDYDEVRRMGSATSPFRTADQTDACRFWESGSPTHLWNRAALDLLADVDTSLSEKAHLLATLNLAVADAVIACWDAKYHYVFWRP